MAAVAPLRCARGMSCLLFDALSPLLLCSSVPVSNALNSSVQCLEVCVAYVLAAVQTSFAEKVARISHAEVGSGHISENFPLWNS